MIQPRVIRLKDAAFYLGMDKNRFHSEVRPNVPEVQIGKQGVAFDRLDLDAWFDDYKASNGRPAKQKGVTKPWRNERHLGSSNAAKSGTSTNESGHAEFVKALEKATSKKPRNT